MSTNDRDTHFLGFAKLLFRELYGVDDTVEYPVPERLIARRAYDLVGHTLDHTNPTIYGFDHIPDLTEWPPKAAE